VTDTTGVGLTTRRRPYRYIVTREATPGMTTTRGLEHKRRNQAPRLVGANPPPICQALKPTHTSRTHRRIRSHPAAKAPMQASTQNMAQAMSRGLLTATAAPRIMAQAMSRGPPIAIRTLLPIAQTMSQDYRMLIPTLRIALLMMQMGGIYWTAVRFPQQDSS